MQLALLHSILITATFIISTGCNKSEVVANYKNQPGYQDASADATYSGDVEAAALAILQKCAKCHAGGASSGGFGIIDDVNAMIATNKYIIPGDAAGSAIYKRIAIAKNMPPSGPLPDTDANIIKQWIESLGLEAAALNIIQRDCVQCHGGGASQGGFGIIEDVPAMIASGKYIIPGNPDGSAIYKRVGVAKNMPPAGPMPDADAETIKQWISGLK